MKFRQQIEQAGFEHDEHVDDGIDWYVRPGQRLLVDPSEVSLFDRDCNELWSVKTRAAALKRLA